MILEFNILQSLLKNLNAEHGNYSVGKQDDSKQVSIFKRGANFVVRIRDSKCMSEVVYTDEEEAVKDFLIDLATGL